MKRLLLIPIALGLVALSACGEAADAVTPATASHTARPRTQDAPDVTPEEFADAFMAAYGDDLDRAADLMSRGADDLNNGDLDAAADKADEAGTLFGRIHDGTPDLPGGDSELGTAITEAAGVCETATHNDADAVRARDYEAMSDTSNIDRCSDDLTKVGTLAESLS